MADYLPAKKSTHQSVRLLFVVEGNSAKGYIDGCKTAAGGQDHIGVLACNVAVSNPRGCSQSNNKLLHRLATIMGLQFNKHYTTPAALAKLKYSMIVLSGDGDVDGWNFNGHLLNAIHFYWPELIEKGSVAIFRPTQSLSLASIQEDNLFLRIQDHLLVVTPGSDPVGALNSAFAFAPEQVQYREERATAAAFRHTNQAGLFTLSPDQTTISIQQYIEICLEHWWFENRRRHLPLFIDGCTPVRRTVLAVMLGGRGDQTTVVSDLAGIICDATDYRHRTEGVAPAIIALGQSDLGTNNFPLLKGQSGFGSKLRAPANPNYLKVQRSPVARRIFSPLLNSDRTRGKVVPDFLLPSLPLQFVNGGEGSLANHCYPSFAVADLKGNVLRRLRGQPLLVMTPQWKGYVGTVERSTATYYTLTPPSAAITGKKGRNVIQGFSARLVALAQDGRVLRFDGPEVMLEAWVDTVLDCLVAQNNLTREQAIFIWIELLEAMPDDLATEEEEEQQQPQQQSQQQQQLPQSLPRSPVVRWAAAEPGGAMAADRAAAAGDDDHFDDVDWPEKTELNETAGQLEDQLKRQLSEKEVELSQTLLRCEKEAAARAAAEKTLREREEELEHQKSVFEQTLNSRQKTLRRQLDKIDDKLSREQSKRRKAERDLEEAIEANELRQKEIEILKKRRG